MLDEHYTIALGNQEDDADVHMAGFLKSKVFVPFSFSIRQGDRVDAQGKPLAEGKGFFLAAPDSTTMESWVTHLTAMTTLSHADLGLYNLAVDTLRRVKIMETSASAFLSNLTRFTGKITVGVFARSLTLTSFSCVTCEIDFLAEIGRQRTYDRKNCGRTLRPFSFNSKSAGGWIHCLVIDCCRLTHTPCGIDRDAGSYMRQSKTTSNQRC